jgi:hypothetical protein
MRPSQFGDFNIPSKSNNDDLPAFGQRLQGSKTWGNNIWSSGTIGSGIGSASRESNRGRCRFQHRREQEEP